jgi:hypothetical protein
MLVFDSYIDICYNLIVTINLIYDRLFDNLDILLTNGKFIITNNYKQWITAPQLQRES